MPILDANVILRYLLGGIPDQAEKAKEAVLSGASTTAEVIAEVVYVLGGVYKADRSTIAAALGLFIQEVEIPNRAALQYALQLFCKRKLDFVDCLLAGYHHTAGSEVMTFDSKLQKVLISDPLSNEEFMNEV